MKWAVCFVLCRRNDRRRENGGAGPHLSLYHSSIQLWLSRMKNARCCILAHCLEKLNKCVRTVHNINRSRVEKRCWDVRMVKCFGQSVYKTMKAREMCVWRTEFDLSFSHDLFFYSTIKKLIFEFIILQTTCKRYNYESKERSKKREEAILYNESKKSLNIDRK